MACARVPWQLRNFDRRSVGVESTAVLEHIAGACQATLKMWSGHWNDASLEFCRLIDDFLSSSVDFFVKEIPSDIAAEICLPRSVTVAIKSDTPPEEVQLVYFLDVRSMVLRVARSTADEAQEATAVMAVRRRPFFLFVGTGVSTAIPVMQHLSPAYACDVCKLAAEPPRPGDPQNFYNNKNKNARSNVSVLLQTPRETVDDDNAAKDIMVPRSAPARQVSRDKTDLIIRDAPVEHLQKHVSTVMVDCGKTFRSAFMDVLLPNMVFNVDTLFLTHDHADAVGGLDDLRDVQHHKVIGLQYLTPKPTVTYLGERTLHTLENQVPYILKASRAPGQLMDRRVTCLDIRSVSEAVDEHVPHRIDCLDGNPNVSVDLFPVWHGKDYVSFGYTFYVVSAASEHATTIVYISDVSAIPDLSMAYLSCLAADPDHPIDVLVVDCLLQAGETHFSHFCIDDSVRLAAALCPRRTFMVGMFCTLEHEDTNRYLAGKLAELTQRQFHNDNESGGSYNNEESTPPVFGRPSNMEVMELAFDGLWIPL